MLRHRHLDAVALVQPAAQAFGVCANEYSPSDGRVVTFDHGCGAHSQVAVASLANMAAGHVIDEVGYDELGQR